MSELTSIEKLDDAVRLYLSECGDDDVLSGWVLAFQTSRFTADERLLPLAFSSDFTMGPSTSPETSMGLAHLTAARLERVLVFGEPDDEA